MPYLGEAPNLEWLNLEGCEQLTKIDPSIGLLRKLTFLNLRYCGNLASLPDSICIQSLNKQRHSEYLKKPYLGGAPIYSQAASSYSKHKDSVTCLFPFFPILPSIRELNLSFCNLVQIPEAIGSLCCLEYLDLSGNKFSTLPSLKKLSKMLLLKLQNCKQLESLPELPSRIDFRSPAFKFIDRREAGLYVFNCPELVEREHCTSMGFSWIIQILHYCMLPQNKNVRGNLSGINSVRSVTPGSEIPRWFNNQYVNMGSSISIDPSHVMHDENWIGVMCCVVFNLRLLFPPGPEVSDIWVRIHVGAKVASDKPEHVCIFFVDRSVFTQRSKKNLKCELDNVMGYHYEVKKYGCRWVYEQDLELQNLTMMHSANSSAQKRKFLAIEEKDEEKRSKGSMSAKLRKDDAANSPLENAIMLLQNQFANLAL